MMRNPIDIGKVDSPACGVSTRGDFEPLVDEATFYRVQAVLEVPRAAGQYRRDEKIVGTSPETWRRRLTAAT